MKKIGIVGDNETIVCQNYCEAVEACSVKAVELDWSGGTEGIKELSGIVIAGGADLNPALYHEENIASRDWNDRLDAFEFQVIKEALQNKMPLLGICRGHQILNVFFGGSLIQNVERCDLHERIGSVDKVHMGRLLRNSFLYDIYQEEEIMINSAHHQAIKELGAGLRAVQFSEDRVIEAFCHKELPIYGVQWHPERMCLKHTRADTVDGLKVFEFFVSRCG
ncbi:MAG: gamma-glutamyl-gamma-aminobutyrate hydrolase family protein [Clostridiales bacterium]|nr:gamma-glutamyl-gamma-aminobutyrate hydrolase family protein [Clostridiales bacterium]